MDHSKSQFLFEVARGKIPGGVNSPVRACKSVGLEYPIFIDRAEGCMVYDADDNGYIDYVGSWGPMILGHRAKPVIREVARVLNKGTSFGAPTALETELAEKIISAVPSMEKVRLVNSGTEATMSAVRLARAFTARDLIVKFDGCYHGHGDALLVEAGSGVATLGIPGSPGVPKSFAEKTISLPYNDMDAVKTLFADKGDQIAAVIVEPVAGNMGLVAPVDGFLQTLRKETEQAGALLILDEVMTGFRVAHGGAQALYKIRPDLTTLGKIIGGGLPVGAYGGREDIMDHVAPEGPMYQAGTLSGNPVAMAAGIATLKELSSPKHYKKLGKTASRLEKGLQKAVGNTGIPVTVSRVGSMLGMFFTDQPVTNYETAKTADLSRYSAYYKGMLNKGVYLAPSQFEVMFVSTAHSYENIDRTVKAAGDVLEDIAKTAE